jgi:hypothetical protein
LAQVAVGLLVLAVRGSAARPNGIWIMADDLGWGEVGFLDAAELGADLRAIVLMNIH